MDSKNFSSFKELTDQDLLLVEGGFDISTDLGYLVGKVIGSAFNPKNLKNLILV
ncbi:hypothetical protein [Bacillus ndiopicus]|uniref:hypothetical protein n=1 Tax=Bacillus ndiopicus TaxID=1347368 RepID=UPI000A8E21C5|nr:hypothetical protein [Bacillus ndiopicus]